MEKPKALTAEEFASWLTPPAALSLFPSGSSQVIKQKIFWRLQAGKIRCAAETATQIHGKMVENLFILDGDIWKKLPNEFTVSSFWSSGDFEYDFGDYTRPRKFRFMGVRFNRTDIGSLLPTAQTATEAVPDSLTTENNTLLERYGYQAKPTGYNLSEQITSEPSEKTQIGKPLSESLLRAWCELYRQAYPAKERSENLAMASVAGMFPGKKVTRVRLRAILEELDAVGRKGRPTADSAD
jgi:hypothetical protein